MRKHFSNVKSLIYYIAREGSEQRLRSTRVASGDNELYGHHDCRDDPFVGVATCT